MTLREQFYADIKNEIRGIIIDLQSDIWNEQEKKEIREKLSILNHNLKLNDYTSVEQTNWAIDKYNKSVKSIDDMINTINYIKDGF